jgi:PAS domain S-box-containing protein
MSPNLLDNPKLFRHVVENLPVGIYIVDQERRIRFWNHGAEHISGYLAHEVVGHVLEDVVQACDREGKSFAAEQRPVTLTLSSRQSHVCTAFFLHKSGHRVPVNARMLPIIAEHGGAIEGVTVLFEEVFAYREELPGPEMYGCMDAITRIPSRRLTQALLNECMAGVEESGVGFGLVRIRLLGLEDFRAKHGSQSIVPFLRTAARTLRHSLDTEYFLGCWEANEFLAVLPSASPVTVATTAETLWNLLNQSEILWWGDRFLVESEVACTVASAGKDLNSLLLDMKPSHSSKTAKAVAAGAAYDGERWRG